MGFTEADVLQFPTSTGKSVQITAATEIDNDLPF